MKRCAQPLINCLFKSLLLTQISATPDSPIVTGLVPKDMKEKTTSHGVSVKEAIKWLTSQEMRSSQETYSAALAKYIYGGVIIKIAKDSYWQDLRNSDKWFSMDEYISFCHLMHHLAGQPESIHLTEFPQVSGDKKHKFYNELLECGSNRPALQRLLMKLPDVKRGQVHSNFNGIAYLPVFDRQHFVLFVALPSVKWIVVYDGYYKNSRYRLERWNSWIYMFLWCLTTGHEVTDFEKIGEPKTLDEVRKGLCETPLSFSGVTPDNQKRKKEWKCCFARDAIIQENNGTECGFLACMNAWINVYGNIGKLAAPPADCCTLEKARSCVLDQYNLMVKELDKQGLIKCNLDHKRRERAMRNNQLAKDTETMMKQQEQNSRKKESETVVLDLDA